MDRDETVTARGRVDERWAEAWLQLVEPAAQRQQSRVNRRMGGVAAKKPGLDQVPCGRGLRALGEKQHQRCLLLGEPLLALADPHDPAGRVEVQPAEAIRAGAPGATLDQPG